MEKINIAKLLKDCPKGMELDCTNYSGEVTFEEIVDSQVYPIKIKIKYGNEYFEHILTKYGQSCKTPYNKCIIFPNGKTTWEGFVTPCKLKNNIMTQKENLLKSTLLLYRNIDRSLTRICDAKRYHSEQDLAYEHNNMESLMTATLQQLSCVIDYLEENTQQ